MPINMRRLAKKYGARKVAGRRRNAPRLRLTRRVARGPAQPVQYFKRTAYYPSWMVASPTADTILPLIGFLNQVPSVSEFTTLYDQYCIKGIKATLIPRFTNAQADDGATLVLPSQVYSILDYDNNIPTTLAGFMQYQNLKMSRGTSLHKRYIKPAVAQEVYGGVLTTAYGIRKNQWIDCDNASVPHYGMGFLIPQLNNVGTGLSYDLKVDYYLAFKNVR